MKIFYLSIVLFSGIGLGCTTVIYPDAAALAAAQIHGLTNHIIWSTLRVKKLNNFVSLKGADMEHREYRED